MMLSVLHTNWWVLALRGLAAVIFGLLTFLMPALTLLMLVSWFGIYCLINGILTLITAFRRSRGQPRWWALILEGVAGVLTGVLTLLWPGVTSLLLLYLVALWAIVTGFLQIGTAIRLRKQLTGEGILILGGLLSVVFGLVLLFSPVTGALVVTWWIGAYIFVIGITLSILAFRLRRSASHDRPSRQ
ncbi:HdeD family acid-resistance protein [Hymenobacter terrenus]|uniref:HdeD family acid-resistance protein n=1 Tax=Hymenobacter terrenus TaxID=1629124 RepID=UPI000698CB37|nr:HdeD family acid-resistance protein [Hymenobacter terrenus]